jgi:flavin-dependent dehydrogenase
MARMFYDALIVGARVAGAATGLRLAAAGARVLIVDRDVAIGDTLSTHALMRPGVELLSRWGLLEPLLRAGTPHVRQAVFQYGSDRVTVPIRPTQASLGLVAPRRWLLDRTILEAAVAAGAELSLGTAIEGVIRDGQRVTGATLRGKGGQRYDVCADTVIGADGRGSRTAEAVGARLLATSPHRTATVYGYFPDIANEGYRWFFGDGASAGAIPTNDGLHCIFAACLPEEHKATFADPLDGMKAIVHRFDPEIADRLAAGPAERLRRFPGAPGHLRARMGAGWALVGDAAFFKDPATAHGITDALLDAHYLSDTIIRRDAREYAGARRAQSLALFETTQRIASFDWELGELRSLHESLNTCMRLEHRAIVLGEADAALNVA